MQVLQTSGLGDGNLSLLAAWNLQLQMAFERMANIKEYRCCLNFSTTVHCICPAPSGTGNEGAWVTTSAAFTNAILSSWNLAE